MLCAAGSIGAYSLAALAALAAAAAAAAAGSARPRRRSASAVTLITCSLRSGGRSCGSARSSRTRNTRASRGAACARACPRLGERLLGLVRRAQRRAERDRREVRSAWPRKSWRAAPLTRRLRELPAAWSLSTMVKASVVHDETPGRRSSSSNSGSRLRRTVRERAVATCWPTVRSTPGGRGAVRARALGRRGVLGRLGRHEDVGRRRAAPAGRAMALSRAEPSRRAAARPAVGKAAPRGSAAEAR